MIFRIQSENEDFEKPVPSAFRIDGEEGWFIEIGYVSDLVDLLEDEAEKIEMKKDSRDRYGCIFVKED